ncbi:MAG TPA: leucyl aminopeptidase [Pseudonocardiaceae bacterium]|nr:leucyl aminopeptidase [Pseudonocardiaceae bacterium]
MPTPKLSLTSSEPDDVAALVADIIVVGTVQGPDGPTLAPGAEAVDAALDGKLLELLISLGAAGKADEIVKLPSLGKLAAGVVLGAGLGKPGADGAVSAEQVRRASGAAARALTGVKRAASTLSSIDLAAAAEGTVLGAYRFDSYKTKPGDEPVRRVEFVAPAEGTGKEHRATLKAATAIGEAVTFARDLINTPPNDLYPATFAQRVVAEAQENGLEIEVLDEKALRKEGYGGVLGVGGGSARPPRVVRLRYKGSKPRAKVALVGKGITFDTGGISLKPAANMDHMTSDMSGAAAVSAVVILAAKLRYPLDVTAVVPMAENMPSGSAYRPGDVLTMFGGKTVEVLNTDAEGRLILADAIVRACQDGPDYLIETSTLTGAQVVALGSRTAGIMGSDEFRDRVATIARATGEGGWAMPLPEELRADIDSKLADIANVSGQRWGGMLVAGTFLKEFVAEGVQWAHVDVAGPAYNTGSPWGYTTKGGTGVPIRTIAAVLADIAEQG